jgi:hypothetical protein
MNLDAVRDRLKYRKEIIPTVLLGIAVLCGVLILVKVTGFFVASARAQSVVKRAIAQSESDSKVVEAQLAKSKPIADNLKKNNLFSPPAPKQHPVKDVFAIFGDEVLINDKWYKVGDRVADAKITAIGPTSVTTEWEGKEKVFYPIQAVVAEAPKPGRGPASGEAKAGEGEGGGERKEGTAEAVTVRVEGGPPGFGGRMGPGGDFMAMRERFENMSEAERERFRDEMRQRAESFGFGGRGGPGGDRGRGGGGDRGPGGRR